jgi:hypothetical protein
MASSGKTSSGKTSRGKTGKADQRAARTARLAAALRQNLKRRKEQARQRAVAQGTPPSAASTQDIETKAQSVGGAPDFRRNRDEE